MTAPLRDRAIDSTSPNPVQNLIQSLRANLAEKELSPPPHETTTEAPAPAWPKVNFTANPRPATPKVAAPLTRRLIKTSLFLALAAAIGYQPVVRLLTNVSTEAIINARVVTLRSPIDGVLNADEPTRIALGANLSPGDVLFHIVDPRADPSKLDDLSHSRAQLLVDRLRSAGKLKDINGLIDDLSTQTRNFADGRLRLLQGRLAELNANLEIAKAKGVETAAAFARASQLMKSDSISGASFSQAKRDFVIGSHAIIVVQSQIEQINVEIDSLKANVFIGDSYNDRPQSAQRLDEAKLDANALKRDLVDIDIQLETLDSEIDRAKNNTAIHANAAITATGRQRLWELFVAPGEAVHKGQELARLLDCADPLISAVVSETVYDGLKLGDAVRFRPRGAGEDLPGVIVALTGENANGDNLAVPTSSLTKDAYHVSIQVPALKQANACDVGRTGTVTFKTEHAS